MTYHTQPLPPEPLAVNPEKAAELIDSTPGSLEKDRAVGHLGIPYVKAGKRIMYCLNDLRAWLEAKKIQPKQQAKEGQHE